MKDAHPIVTGIDFSENSRHALMEACRIAKSSGSVLHAAHIITADVVEDQHELYHLSIDETLERTRTKLAEFCNCIAPDPSKLVLHAIIGHPYHDLVDLIKKVKASMLIMGSRGTSTETHHTGMIATQCARHAPVPVMLIREHQCPAFKKIIACTDFSEPATHAVTLAAEIADKESATLEVIHLHYPPWMLPRNVLYNLERTPESEFREKYQNLLTDRLNNAVAAIHERFPKLTVTPIAIAHSNLHFGIAQHLRDSECDLVVIGSRGRTRLRDMLLGSTAERLIRQSPCSILIDRPVKH